MKTYNDYVSQAWKAFPKTYGPYVRNGKVDLDPMRGSWSELETRKRLARKLTKNSLAI